MYHGFLRDRTIFIIPTRLRVRAYASIYTRGWIREKLTMLPLDAYCRGKECRMIWYETMTVVSRENAGDFNARVEGQAMSRERSSTFFTHLVITNEYFYRRIHDSIKNESLIKIFHKNSPIQLPPSPPFQRLSIKRDARRIKIKTFLGEY